jgi:hypothetical protein
MTTPRPSPEPKANSLAHACGDQVEHRVQDEARLRRPGASPVHLKAGGGSTDSTTAHLRIRVDGYTRHPAHGCVAHARLSVWISDHLQVTPVVVENPDVPVSLEEPVLQRLDLPLNLQRMTATPYLLESRTFDVIVAAGMRVLRLRLNLSCRASYLRWHRGRVRRLGGEIFFSFDSARSWAIC